MGHKDIKTTMRFIHATGRARPAVSGAIVVYFVTSGESSRLKYLRKCVGLQVSGGVAQIVRATGS